MNKAPWSDCPEVWKDEKAFFNWLRSQTRRVWSRHPIKIEYKKGRRFKAPIGLKDKEVWACHCEICNELVPSGKCEIDHIEAGGSFTDWKTYTEWARRILWVTFDDIRELCKECHEVVTLSQRMGISFEQAKVEKAIIAACKEDKQWLTERGHTPASNAKLRKEQIRTILEGEMNE